MPRLFVAIILVLLAASPAAAARPGDLEPSYGTGGVRTLAVGVSSSARALAVTPGGGVALAGTTEESGAERSLVARLAPGGAFDPAFNGGVALRPSFGASPDPPQRAAAVALQPDGKTLVAGVAGKSWYVARYLPTGAPDSSFGAAGVVLTRVGAPDDFPPEGGPVALAVRPDGRILVLANVIDTEAGPPPDGTIVLLGLMPNGTRDLAFGSGGVVSSQLGVSSSRVRAASVAGALALQPDGAALVAGRATDRKGLERPVVARYLAGGRRDNGFGEGGRALLGGEGDLKAMTIAPPGSIVVAGSGARATVLAATLSAAGAVLFRHDMQLGTGSSPVSAAAAVALDSAERPVLAGQALVDGVSSVLVARLRPTGGLDCSFGADGRALYLAGRGTTPAGPARAAAIAPDGAGAMLVAGAAPRAPQEAAFVARVEAGDGPAPAARRPRASIDRATPGRPGAVSVHGLVDGRCATTRWRLEYGERSLTATTTWQPIGSRAGPQGVCVPLKGLRAGRRYRVRLVARNTAGTTASAPLAFTAPVRRSDATC